jgi:hypothetical protein
MRSPDPRVPIILACLAAATVLTAPSAAAATPVAPQVLAGPGLATSAVDISPLGVVVGMSGPAEPFPGDPAQEARPFRWIPRLDGTYRRQALPVPADATAAGVAGVTNAGAAGGYVATPAGTTATRWPVLGGPPQSIATSPSKVSAVGPAQMLVEVPPPGSGFGGGLELVRADGTRADVDAVFPNPEFARGFFGASVGGRDAVSFGVFGGAGQGSFVEPWVWVAGAGTPLPVRSTFFFGSACTSEILADGTQAYSGLIFEERRFVVGIHRGGVPGTEVELPVPEGLFGRLTCDDGTDALHPDGTVVGAVGTDAAVWRGEVLTRIAPEAGETSVRAAAVASRGRVVIVAGAADGTEQPYLWRDGQRRALQLPAGTSLRDVVEFTDTGLVLANVAGADGAVQTVVWRT